MNRTVPSTGSSPSAHNRHCASEKALDLAMKGLMRLDSPSGRRRKKHIMKVEGGQLRTLVAVVAQDLYEKRDAA